MSAIVQAIQNTTKGFLRNYVDACQAKNPRLLSTCVSEDCIRRVGPPSFLRSVGAPHEFSMSNAEYEAEFGNMEFYSFKAHDIYDLTIDAPNLKAAARSELFGTFIDGKDFSRTFVWFLDFNDDGSKIVKVYQHNDAEEGRNFRLTIRSYHEAEVHTAN